MPGREEGAAGLAAAGHRLCVLYALPEVSSGAAFPLPTPAGC